MASVAVGDGSVGLPQFKSGLYTAWAREMEESGGLTPEVFRVVCQTFAPDNAAYGWSAVKQANAGLLRSLQGLENLARLGLATVDDCEIRAALTSLAVLAAEVYRDFDIVAAVELHAWVVTAGLPKVERLRELEILREKLCQLWDAAAIGVGVPESGTFVHLPW